MTRFHDEDTNDAPPQTGETIKTIAELVLKDEGFRHSVGRRASYAILLTLALATVKLTIGIPFFSLGHIPLAGIFLFFLISAVDDWLRSKRPSVTFYLYPDEGLFIPLNRTSPRIYRKLKSCPHCGSALLNKCRQRKHPIVSPDPGNPDLLPQASDFCPFCDPALPKEYRAYLPANSTNVPAES
jgi:hypothetical protein